MNYLFDKSLIENSIEIDIYDYKIIDICPFYKCSIVNKDQLNKEENDLKLNHHSFVISE